MSTHDYVINNQSASAFRADLNDALQAIVTTNSGSTAPATTYANMLWYDTASNQLKKRNEANSLWIILGTINETGGTFTTSGERSLATLAQAEAGTDNTTIMTPLRTAQAITAQIPPQEPSMTLLGTLTTTSGSTQTLSGLDLTSYQTLFVVVNGVRKTANTAFLTMGGQQIAEATDTSTRVYRGVLHLDLLTGIFSSAVVINSSNTTPNSGTSNIYGGDVNITTSSTSVSFGVTSGTFDAGTIRVFGVK